VIAGPRDRTGYGIALASLGVALAIVLIGICWIAVQRSDEPEVTVHGCFSTKRVQCSPEVAVRGSTNPPSALWVAFGALTGVVVGVLIPFPRESAQPLSEAPSGIPLAWLWPAIVAAAAAVSLVVAHDNHESLPFYVAGVLFVGLFVGLLIPSPGQRD